MHPPPANTCGRTQAWSVEPAVLHAEPPPPPKKHPPSLETGAAATAASLAARTLVRACSRHVQCCCHSCAGACTYWKRHAAMRNAEEEVHPCPPYMQRSNVIAGGNLQRKNTHTAIAGIFSVVIGKKTMAGAVTGQTPYTNLTFGFIGYHRTRLGLVLYG